MKLFNLSIIELVFQCIRLIKITLILILVLSFWLNNIYIRMPRIFTYFLWTSNQNVFSGMQEWYLSRIHWNFCLIRLKVNYKIVLNYWPIYLNFVFLESNGSRSKLFLKKETKFLSKLLITLSIYSMKIIKYMHVKIVK